MTEDTTLYILDHGWLECDRRLHYPLDTIGTRDNPNPEIPWERIPTFSLLVEYPDATIAIDTGSHPRGMDDYWPDSLQNTVPWVYDDESLYHNRLSALGYSFDDIDAVVQTHLHNDHAGNLERYAEQQTPIYCHRAELKWAFYMANVFSTADERGAYVPADFTHEGLDWRPLSGNRGKIHPDLEWIHLPGHTPGTIGLLLTALDEPVFIIGDAIFRNGNLHPEPVPPAVNWDHSEWQTTTVPRVRDTISNSAPNSIFGHDPLNYNEYGSFPDVQIIGETTFD